MRVTLFIFYYFSEVDVVNPPKPGFNSGIFIPVLNITNNNDINGNLALLRKVINKRIYIIYPTI